MSRSRSRTRTGDDSLWRYQQGLVAARQDHDSDAARLPLNNEALIDATARIKEQLAAQGVSAA